VELPKFYNPVQTLLAARRETTSGGGGGGANAGEGGQQQQQQQSADGVEGTAEDAGMQVLSPSPRCSHERAGRGLCDN
jgi:hypothetical protein